MPVFLSFVLMFLGVINFGAYSMAADLLPQQTLTNLIMATSPLVIFTIAVVIALAFMGAQLKRIEPRLGQLDR